MKEQIYKVVVNDSCTFWYNDKNQLHRIDGPAIESANGYKAWYIDDKLHRIDGPAVEYLTGSKAWYQNGELHRLDGPAVECANGSKSWYIDGNNYSETEFNKKIAKMNVKNVESTIISDLAELAAKHGYNLVKKG